jgi:carbamate kinase
MLVVVALGGNALLKRGEPVSADVQRRNVRVAAEAIAALAKEHKVVVTHGNGPQVGLLALQAASFGKSAHFPLDVLGAESEGMIGYVIEQELGRCLPGREIATLLTQVVVDARDPAFKTPTKPVGPLYDKAEAVRLGKTYGWPIAADGAGFRRVVPSPKPLRIRELATIRLLVEAGVTVICAGGGGIPVIVTEQGAVMGVEAVIDKDLSASLLARELHADALLILTDVVAVYSGWGTPGQHAIRKTTPGALAREKFAPGSMGPKVEAACGFVKATGGIAAIGALADAPLILRGAAGTIVSAK